MRVLVTFTALASVLLFVNARNTPTADAFVRSKIVPDIIPAPPQGLISATFSNGSRVNLGNVLSPGKLQGRPNVEWNGDDYALYTFMIVDPDAPSNSHPSARSWVHWLVVNQRVNTLLEGDVLEAYNGPTPPSGTGLHRYVFLAYKQQGPIQPYYSGISGFNVQDFVTANNLVQPPVAGNFFRAQHD